jgi:hypothetical protein
MAKKSSGKSSSATKSKSESGMSADEHRKTARMLQAKASLHHAKADVKDAANPPKKPRHPWG